MWEWLRDFLWKGNYPMEQAHVDLRIGYSLINMMDPVQGHYAQYNKTPEPYARNINVTFSVGYLIEDMWTKKNQP